MHLGGGGQGAEISIQVALELVPQHRRIEGSKLLCRLDLYQEDLGSEGAHDVGGRVDDGTLCRVEAVVVVERESGVAAERDADTSSLQGVRIEKCGVVAV